MLTGCKFENYKAFVSGSLQIRPLTILLGANGVGKTSLLQIFQLMQQTHAASSARYKSALKLHGRNVSMGEAESLFHQRNTKTPHSLRFEIIDEALKSYLSSRLVNDFKANIFNLYSYLFYMITRRPEKSRQRPARRFYGFEDKTLRDVKDVLDEISKLRENLLPEEAELIPPFSTAGGRSAPYPASSRSRLQNGDLKPVYDFMSSLEELASSRFELDFEIHYSKKPNSFT